MRRVKIGMLDVLRKRDIMFLMNVDPVQLMTYSMVEREILVPVSAATLSQRDALSYAMSTNRYVDGNVFTRGFTPPTPGLRMPRPHRLANLWRPGD